MSIGIGSAAAQLFLQHVLRPIHLVQRIQYDGGVDGHGPVAASVVAEGAARRVNIAVEDEASPLAFNIGCRSCRE